MTIPSLNHAHELPDLTDAIEDTYIRREPMPETPMVVPVQLSKSKFLALAPLAVQPINELLAALESAAFDVGGLVLEQGVIPEDLIMAGGKVLLAVLPPTYERHLSDMASQKLEPMIYMTLDLQESFAINYWSVKLDDDTSTTFAWDSQDTNGIATEHSKLGQRLWFTRVVLIAGDSVAIGGFWQNEDDMDCAAATGVCPQSYVEYSEEELERAREATVVAGSPNPWFGVIYEESDKHRFAHIPMANRAVT